MIKEQPLCVFTVLKAFFSLLLVESLLNETASLLDKDIIFDVPGLFL